MLDYMQNCIIISYKKNGKTKEVENRIFNGGRALNGCFNELNNLKCAKEVWLDEAYISFTFKTAKSYNKALKVLKSFKL